MYNKEIWESLSKEEKSEGLKKWQSHLKRAKTEKEWIFLVLYRWRKRSTRVYVGFYKSGMKLIVDEMINKKGREYDLFKIKILKPKSQWKD